ncbi:hypothetical protein ACRAWD_23015 [Caulobacter segnis]
MIEIGTSCRRSARRWAVTTIGSSSALEAEVAAGVALGRVRLYERKAAEGGAGQQGGAKAMKRGHGPNPRSCDLGRSQYQRFATVTLRVCEK